jgi:ABC-type dipeptide/oligopeptide/nickel transport system permease component
MLLAISIGVFLILHLIPGDPARSAAGPDASEEDIDLIRKSYGLDKPLPFQYWIYLKKLVRGDLGRSFRTRRPVTQEIRRRLPATAELSACAMLIAVVLGIPIGIISSLRPKTLLDNIVTFLAVFGISMPIFFLGLILMILFSAILMWLPPTGRGGLARLILPSFTLGLPYVATIARLTRSNMLDVISEDYIRTARSKGLNERIVVYKHALTNALIPVVTILGLYFGRMLGGAVITETVFAWPGLGRYMIDAIIMRDIYVVQGTILVFAIAVVVVNLIVDLLYGLLDPRITYS